MRQSIPFRGKIRPPASVAPRALRPRLGSELKESPITDDIDALELLGRADASTGLDADALFTALYHELHRLAERQLRRDGSDLSIGPTTLLHEAYLDMSGRAGTSFPDRARFMAYTARAMRALIISYARRARAQKRGGRDAAITLTASDVVAGDAGLNPADLEALSHSLDELAAVDPLLSQLVDLHFFCGFTLSEIAEQRRVSVRTVQRDWQKARLLLHRLMRET